MITNRPHPSYTDPGTHRNLPQKPSSTALRPTTHSPAGSTLATTFHHPFYDVTQAAFVEAQHLHLGDQLQTPTGFALVTGLRDYHQTAVTYDLTIGALHTYYVSAGTHRYSSTTAGIA
jgi:Pretoxin HINT domain